MGNVAFAGELVGADELDELYELYAGETAPEEQGIEKPEVVPHEAPEVVPHEAPEVVPHEGPDVVPHE